LSKAGQSAPVLFAGAAALDKAKDVEKGLLVDFTVKSTPGVFVDDDDDLELDTGVEKKSVQNLAAAVTRRLGEGKDAAELRAFVLGDADVVSDFWFAQDRNNQLLFVEAVRWLGGEESFSGEIQSEEDVALVHTKADDQVYFYGTILGAPSLVLGLGMFFTLRRRRDPRGTEAPAKAGPPPDKKPVKKAPAALGSSAPKTAAKSTEPEPPGDAATEDARDEGDAP